MKTNKRIKHTSGIWELSEDGRYVINGRNILIADCYADTPLDFGLPETFEEARANARLISAAPDLLTAVRTLVDYMLETHQDELETQHHGDSTHDGESPEDCSYCAAIDEARLAIARAKEDRQ